MINMTIIIGKLRRVLRSFMGYTPFSASYSANQITILSTDGTSGSADPASSHARIALIMRAIS